MIKEKKGSGALEGILTGFVIIGAVLMLLVLIIYVFGSVNTSLETMAPTQTSINESAYLNSSNGGGYQLADGITGTPRTFAVVQLINNTNSQIINLANASISSTGLMTNTSSVVYSDLLVTYTYTNNSAEQVASIDAQTNSSRAIPIVGILFIIMAVGALIAIIFMSIIGKRRS